MVFSYLQFSYLQVDCPEPSPGRRDRVAVCPGTDSSGARDRPAFGPPEFAGACGSTEGADLTTSPRLTLQPTPGGG